jgi:23S rRNA (pseudouridine1915-N3)-methyltransferase
MASIEFITVGKLKNDPLLDVFDDYKKRLTWKFTLHELEGKSQADQLARISEKLNPNAALIVMDERGKSLASRDFAAKMDQWQTAFQVIQFVIGGADGLSDEIRKKATMLLSLGSQTWPHMLARVMLMEQVYRAQQILSGHPYHRD